ncbi:MAG: LysR family transcriptional regulator [Ilumatobacteraceae bacterium]
MARLHDLELRHLIALDAVATEGTFGRAALRLGYTQSAVSQQIAALERLLGNSVFDRPGGPRPVELTPLGKLVLTHARDVIGRVDAAGDAIERFLAGDSGRIDVGTFQSVSAVLLPAIVARLRREQPALDIRLFEDEHKEEGCRRVLDGELDVTFCVGTRAGELESIVLLDDPFVLVARRGELAKGPYPTRQLDEVSLVGYPAGPCQQEIEDGMRVLGAEASYVFRTNDNGAQIAMVRAGMGWAVMPLLAVDAADPTIDVRSLRPAIPPRQVCLVWRRDRTLSPTASRLIDIAADVARDHGRLPASA